MRQVVVSAGAIDVVDVDAPRPGSGEVLVRSVVAGVCGSDTHAAAGLHPWISLPYVPGHEVVGVIAETGAGVPGLEPGRRVTVEPYLPCWNCKQCRRGLPNICENLGFLGCGDPQGAMADYFTVDARRVHVIPDELDDRAAALIEPLSTPVHAVRLAGGVAQRAVAILGAGTIGLLLLRVVVSQGAQRVVVTAPRPDRRRLALALGADAAVDAYADDAVDQVRAALGESADVVFDCVATEATTSQAIGMADKGGTVVVVGVPSGEVQVPLQLVQDRQIRIQGSATYLPQDVAGSIELLTSGVVRPDDFITSVVPMESIAEAFEQAASPDHIKVLVAINDAAEE
ncbi:MAG: alcohol dehydrogenase catalytic domain-containing protein [Mycobacteriaceae bacterium]|nr:alcohol dehydrogenase catalytic domain-containing protein [Mycobacteriaceae bacterium]